MTTTTYYRDLEPHETVQQGDQYADDGQWYDDCNMVITKRAGLYTNAPRRPIHNSAVLMNYRPLTKGDTVCAGDERRNRSPNACWNKITEPHGSGLHASYEYRRLIPTHRTLEPTETVRAGDQYYDGFRWYTCMQTIGLTVADAKIKFDFIFQSARRPLPVKPDPIAVGNQIHAARTLAVCTGTGPKFPTGQVIDDFVVSCSTDFVVQRTPPLTLDPVQRLDALLPEHSDD